MSPGMVDLPLRDWHLPPSVSWWPPAVGWWLLLALLLSLALGLYFWRRYQRRRRLLVAALEQLELVVSAYQQSNDPQQLAADLSVLLRRLCLTLYPRQQVAALTGEAWLTFLDRQAGLEGAADGFCHGEGRVLTQAPYRPGLQFQPDRLLCLCQRWIESTTPGKGGA